jgi:hypothetical protein
MFGRKYQKTHNCERFRTDLELRKTFADVTEAHKEALKSRYSWPPRYNLVFRSSGLLIS